MLLQLGQQHHLNPLTQVEAVHHHPHHHKTHNNPANMINKNNRKAGKIYPAPITDPAHARTTPTYEQSPIDCEYQGRTIQPPPGADPSRKYALCLHPSQPMGEVVCRCRGCGPDCVGYCPDDTEPARAETLRRHLLYHIYPLKSASNIWRWRLAQILTRWNQFSSHVITIGIDDETESADAVGELLPPGTTMVVERANRDLGETAHWHRGWETLLSGNVHSNDIVLRAHAKGVTRPMWDYRHDWADWLVHLCCDYHEILHETMAQRPLSGPLMLGHKAPWNYAPHCTWHYAGSWYWVRAGDAADRYRIITPNRFGVESWPGQHWRKEDAARIYRSKHDFGRDHRWWQVNRDLIQWSQKHRTNTWTRNLPTIEFVTPVTRDAMIPTIENGLRNMARQQAKWHRESGGAGDWGGAARNAGLAKVGANSLVYFLDDDTLPHPHLIGIAGAAMEYAPDADGWIVGQLRGKLGPIMPGEIRYQGIDTGSVIWKRKTLDGLEWGHHRLSDWKLIEDAVKRGANLISLPVVGSLYNWLR